MCCLKLFRNGLDWKQARSAMSHYFTSYKLKNLMNHYKLVTDNFLNNVEDVRKRTGSDLIDVRMMTKCFGVDMIAKVIMAIDIDSFKQRDSEFVKQANKIGEVNILQIVGCTSFTD